MTTHSALYSLKVGQLRQGQYDYLFSIVLTERRTVKDKVSIMSTAMTTHSAFNSLKVQWLRTRSV